MGRRRDVLLRGQGAVLGIDPHRSAGLGVHRARNQDLRPDPEDLLLRRTAGARVPVRPPARQLEDGLHLGAQHAVPGGAGDGSDTYQGTIDAGAAGTDSNVGAFGPLSGVFLLIPFIVFFNLWSNWGATLYGRSVVPRTSARTSARWVARWSRPRSWPRSRFSCSRRRSAGTSTTRRTTATGAAGAVRLRQGSAAYVLRLSGPAWRFPDGRRVLAVPPRRAAVAVVLRLGRDGVPVIDAGRVRDRFDRVLPEGSPR